MSVGSGGLGTVYSRLPQSTSDVETSEDEVSQHENLIFYRKMGTPKKANMKKEDSNKVAMKDYQPLGHETGPGESREVHINGFSNINYNYVHGTGGPGTEEETMVLGTLGVSGSSGNKKDGEGRHGNLQLLVGNRHPMSMMRQVTFVMSLCLCIFVIVAFLWVLPCNWSTCPIMQYDKQGGSSWERTLCNIELIGGINVVPSGNDQHNNLLFMYRGEIDFPDQGKEQERTVFTKLESLTSKKEGHAPKPPGGSGLVALMGSSGAVAWFKPLQSVPRDVDCSLIDVNGDGKNDCLLIDSNHLMCAFEPVSSLSIWCLSFENNSDFIPSDMEFPLILPDVDDDTILDLAIACRMLKRSINSTERTTAIFADTLHNRIAIASGKTGKLIGNAFVDESCKTVYKLALDKAQIMYRCVDFTGKELVKDISLHVLYTNITGNNSSWTPVDYSKRLGDTLSLKQHVLSQNYGPPELNVGSGEPDLQTNKPSTYAVHGKKLTILNQGHCPEDCKASARVFDEKKGPNSSVWSDGGKNVYALHPAVLLFNSQPVGPGTTEKSAGSSTDGLLGIVSGFAVKFWHWTNCEKTSIWSPARQRQKRSKEKDWENILQSKDHWHDGTTETKNPEYIESRESRIDSSGINTTTKSFSRNTSTVTVTYHPKEVYNAFCLKERIVLVTFNDTDVHLVNASESEIKQLCSSTSCQPSLPYQEQSLIIADLDGDGSKELVSYLTTYETGDENKPTESTRLNLVSKVRVVRLEAELPKLYEAFSHS